MKKIVALILLCSLFSCQKKEDKIEEKKSSFGEEKKLEMYQMSEMAALMEQMYVDNKRLKEHIQKGDTIGKFPEHFLKIHTAKFTDETENDLFFKQKAKDFITAQRLLYSDSENRKANFNATVDACLNCHESKCGGPIPRIKKLYIK